MTSGGPPAEPASARGSAPLPVGLRVGGRRCVVVGAGTVGGRRARTLVEAGAEVVVVAPEAVAEVVSLAEAGRLRWERRAFVAGDAAGAFLVLAATDAAEVNAAVAAAAGPGTLVARADHAPSTDVTFPSTVHRGPVTVTVATSGRAPAVGAWLADRLDESLDDLVGLDAAGLLVLVDLVAELRGTGVTPPGGDWRSALRRCMLDDVLLDLIRSDDRARAMERLQACLSSS